MVPILRRYVRIPAVGVGFVALALTGVVLTDPVTSERAELAAAPAAPAFHQVSSDTAFRAGTSDGVAVREGSLVVTRPVARTTWGGRTYDYSRWTSPWVVPGGSFSQLIPSWNAITPANTYLTVQARVRSTKGRLSSWKTMARWSTRDLGIRRTGGTSQRDAVAWVDTDTLKASSGVALNGYQLRVFPARASGVRTGPTVRSVQAVASTPVTSLPATSRPLLRARTLDVPRYSQMTHRGQYPQYGGGGQAWCSPTSLSMILGYYRKLPSTTNYAWVSKRYADPWVDHVARLVYDYGYHGAGNWAFNTAYASVQTGDAFVTRMASLRDAERFVAAGIPVAASISFARGQLTGAPIGATSGHLVVIAGFTASGNVVVNDPAAPSDASVRRVYDRGQFERAWLRRSSGTAYVVHDSAHPLPARGANRNW